MYIRKNCNLKQADTLMARTLSARDFTEIRGTRPKTIIWGAHNEMAWVQIEHMTRYTNLDYYATRAFNISLIYFLYLFV